MDIRRFGRPTDARRYTLARSIENYATYYDIHYPNEERQSGRPLRIVADLRALAGLGAVVRREVRLGAPELVRARTPPPATRALRPRGWAGEHWSPAIGAEALATRQAAGLFDETSFAKIEIVGPGAVAFLQSMCANDVDVPVGRITYTQLLNRRGGIECDVTVTRVTADRYLFITGTAFGQHDLAWLRRHLPDDGGVLLNDLTSGRVCFALWGPRARDILASVTRDDVSDAAFPYLTARAITVGSVPVYALRVTYVGELGWELYAHTEFGVALWRTLWEAGRPHGMVAGGYRAIDALRIEKGYRVWSSDITPDETPYEAGLGFAVALDKGVDFIGRDALVAAKAAGPRKRLRCLVLDDPRSVCLGNEPVRLDGEIVGRVTTGGYGFAVERSIAYAYLPPDRPRSARAARSRSSASGSASRSPASRCTTPTARGSARDRAPIPATIELAHAFALAMRCDEADAARARALPPRPVIETKPDRTFVTQADTAIERLIRERIGRAYPGPRPRRRGIRHGGRRRDRPLVHRPDRRHAQLHARRAPVRDAARGRGGRRDGGRRDERAGAGRALVRDTRRRARGRSARWAGGRDAAPDRCLEGRRDRRRPGPLFVAARHRGERARRRASMPSCGRRWRDRGFGDFWGYALVAEGAAEAMIEVGPKSWDLAAPSIVVEEAGGRMTDLHGVRSIHAGTALATNGLLHDEVVRALRG